jgi:adenylate cyclase
VSRMDEFNRRLAGILAADVVGYSAKMGADDAKPLARVRTLRTEVIEPLAATHGGRLFKTVGDGFLVEFPSAVQALRCAIAIQTALNAQAEGLRLRIGLHQGRWSRMAKTCSATASSSRPGWNRWRKAVAS